MKPVEPISSVVTTNNPLRTGQPDLEQGEVEIITREEHLKRINTNLNNCILCILCVGIITGILIALLYVKR
jgi:sensor c-di-GMP phosphodiesterase-like protein